MPECHRCRRDLATCELRRTKLGFVCKEGAELGEFSRCARIARELRAAARAARRLEKRSAAA